MIFASRAYWDANATSTFINLRGIELHDEFDVSRGKHIEVGWRKVRLAMIEKLGAAAPWFVCGAGAFNAFCKEHGVDENKYLEEVFRIKAAEKWKYLQDVYKAKQRGTVTIVDEHGKTVKQRANSTGERKLDEVDWPFYAEMQQAMLRRPSVCPPENVFLRSYSKGDKSSPNTPTHLDDKSDEDSPSLAREWNIDNLPTSDTPVEGNNKRSARNDEANSPVRPSHVPGIKGRRPSNADRRHGEVLTAMAEHSTTTSESFSKVVASITAMQKELRTVDAEAQILDRALRIQSNWEERYMFLLAQKFSPAVIISQIGEKPTAEQAIEHVLTLQETLRKSR